MSKRGNDPAASEESIGPRASVMQLVDLDKLDVNPVNPAARTRTADDALVASFKNIGQLQPIVVLPKPDGRFAILAGHRRTAAARAAGWTQIQAVVFDGDVSASGSILAAENMVRRDFAPLEEAAVVTALLEHSTQQQVADALGRSVKWVARRANIATLSPLARRAMASATCPLSKWPPTWLEELALLAPKAQDTFLDSIGVNDANLKSGNQWSFRDFNSIDQLQADIREQLRPLRLATWDLHDAKLVKSVGSCADCPKTSCAAKLLFGDVPGDHSKLDDALCRDEVCWNGKAEAHLKRRADESRKEHGPALVFIATTPAQPATDAIGDSRVLRSHQYSKGTKAHGVPAMIVDGPKAGTVTWIAKSSGARTVRDPETGEQRVATIGDKRRALHRRRETNAVQQLAKAFGAVQFADLKRPSGMTGHSDVEFLFAFIVRATSSGVADNPFHRSSFAYGNQKGGKLGWVPSDKMVGDIFHDVAGSIEHRLSSEGTPSFAGASNFTLEELAWLADLVEFDSKAAFQRAVDELPEPKSWAKAEAEAKSTNSSDAEPPSEDETATSPKARRAAGKRSKRGAK